MQSMPQATSRTDRNGYTWTRDENGAHVCSSCSGVDFNFGRPAQWRCADLAATICDECFKTYGVRKPKKAGNLKFATKEKAWKTTRFSGPNRVQDIINYSRAFGA